MTRAASGFELALAVWRRRKWLGIVVFAALLSATLSVAKALPNLYQSRATVLVERRQVPEAFVRAAVTGEVETRLHTISQEILSRARLGALIARFDLYPDLRRQVSREAAIERMRRDIKLEPREVAQSGGRATIAFALSYQGRDAAKVALVTNTLTSFYLEENLKLRERQATGTAEFLKAQLEEMKKRLEEQKRLVTEFKLRHVGELPHQVAANLITLDRLSGQLRLNTENQTRAVERREALMKQLAEADALGPAGGPVVAAARIARLRQELAELRTRFSDKYPDVLRVKEEIAFLERQLAAAQGDGAPGGEPTAPGARAFRGLRQALREVEAQIEVLKSEEKTLRQAIAAYVRRVEDAPKREQEFQEVSLDYETTKELYYSLLKRHEEAQLAESMEQRQRGEQFRILDPAIASKEPVAPNRLRLVALGLLLSLVVAGGSVVLAERLDSSFHALDDLRAFTSVPIVARIPRILTDRDARRRRWRLWLATVAVGLGLALIGGAAYYVAHDNEQLVWTLARSRS
ncbi:MAG: hypothetical protein HYV62_12425 [Candidatus Rokubacteria bacterium]|nr:hypothetical protein [Candidatus Rokubacteria bacterium]